MCLFTKHYLPKKAKKPIEVIKLVRKTEEPGVYIPFCINSNNLGISISHKRYPNFLEDIKKFRYTLGERSYGIVGSLFRIIYNLISYKVIGEGFIHSIQYPKSYFKGDMRSEPMALSYIINYVDISLLDSNNGAYIKCVIPRESWYYTDGLGEYASREIIPIEDVTEEIKKTYYEKYK